jgi:hypothetical protein
MLVGQDICLVLSYMLSTEFMFANLNEKYNSGDSDEYEGMG